MNYPKRGQISEDGKYYTHTDGSVHEATDTNCQACTGFTHDFCSPHLRCSGGWSRIEGAYVTTGEERAACDMARAQIAKCGGPESTRCLYYGGGALCDDITNHTCPARAYLAAHGQPDAWEVKT